VGDAAEVVSSACVSNEHFRQLWRFLISPYHLSTFVTNLGGCISPGSNKLCSHYLSIWILCSEQMLYLMHFSYLEVVLKSNKIYTLVYLIVLKLIH